MANGARLNVLRDCQKKFETLTAEDVSKQFEVFDVVLEFQWQFDAIGDDLWRFASRELALESGNVGAVDLD